MMSIESSVMSRQADLKACQDGCPENFLTNYVNNNI